MLGVSQDMPGLKEVVVKGLLNGFVSRKFKKLIRGYYSRLGGYSYNDDGLITYHHSDFLNDPLFIESYRLGKATGSWRSANVEWRTYIVCWAAAKGKNLEGDFVECGVNKGGYSRAVMHYVDFKSLKDRTFYLCDTFNGFPEDSKHLAPPGALHRYRECYDEVVQTFREFDNVRIIRGKVPDTLSHVKADKVCYLSLDMNYAEPEIAAAEHFWDRLVSGAVIVLDDYGYSDNFLKIKHSFDDFARKRNVQVLLLPTGQGLIFKP